MVKRSFDNYNSYKVMLNHYYNKYHGSSSDLEKEKILQEFKRKMNMVRHYHGTFYEEIDLENYNTINMFMNNFNKRGYPQMIVYTTQIPENRMIFILGA